jgi:hypothetical protein
MVDIPRLTCPYPMRTSVHYDATLNDELDAWILSSTPLDDEQRQKARAFDYSYLVAVCWPESDRRRLWDFTTLAVALMERDGDYDTRRYGASLAELRASAADARAQYATVTEPRWGPLLAGIWRSFAGYVSAPQMTRFAQVMATFLDGCVAYDERLIESGPFIDVDDYLDARCRSVGQLIDHVMLEISLGIDIGAVLEEPALKAVVQADVERVAFCQDILSLRKDLAEGEDAENVVLVITRARSCPLPSAIAEACRIYDEKTARFDRLAERLAGTSLGREREVSSFVEGLRSFTAGLIEWTLRSARYTPEDTSRRHAASSRPAAPRCAPVRHPFPGSCATPSA